MVKKITDESDEESIIFLSHQLEGCPMTLYEAASFIAKEKLTVSAYLQSLEKDVKASSRAKVSEDWIITFDTLAKELPRAFSFLNMSAHLASSPIPEQWIMAWLHKEDEGRMHGLDAIASFWQIRETFASFGLATYEKSAKVLCFLNESQQAALKNQPEPFVQYKIAARLLSERWNEDAGIEEANVWKQHAEVLLASPLFSMLDQKSQEKLGDQLGYTANFLFARSQNEAILDHDVEESLIVDWDEDGEESV